MPDGTQLLVTSKNNCNSVVDMRTQKIVKQKTSQEEVGQGALLSWGCAGSVYVWPETVYCTPQHFVQSAPHIQLAFSCGYGMHELWLDCCIGQHLTSSCDGAAVPAMLGALST